MGRKFRDIVGIVMIFFMTSCYVDSQLPETPVYDGKEPVVTATPIPAPTVAITGYPIPY